MYRPIIFNISAKSLWAILPPFLTVAILGWAPSTLARDYKVGGGLTTGYEFYDRQYNKDMSNESESIEGGKTINASAAHPDERYNRFRIGPLIIVSSASARDELSLNYSPSFRYDYETSDHDVDHNLSAAFKRSITRDWLLKLTERYLLTDTSNTSSMQNYTEKSSTVQISDNNGRRKYWTNDVGLVTEYGYWEDSLFSLGYTFGNYRNIDAEKDLNSGDYDRHEGSLSVSHRIDSIWRLTGSGNYVRGLYDVGGGDTVATETNKPSDKNVSEYGASTILESRLIEHNPLSLAYNFFRTDYDAADQSTVDLHDMTAGWLWEISKNFSMSMGGGPSFQKREGGDGNWSYNANAKVKYALEHGSLDFSANHGYQVQNFNGTNENGLSEFSQARLGFNYEILQDVSLGMFTSYRYEDQEEITDQPVVATESATTTEANQIITKTDIFNRQRFAAGTILGYKFARWYAMNLSYDYLLQDSEKVNDSYDEHRLVLSLSVQKELFNW